MASKVQFAKSATGANVTSISATLTATTAGNMLVAIVVIGGNQTPTPPTGWVKDIGPISTEATPLTNIFIYHLANCAAGITSVAFTLTSNGANLSVWEFTGMPTTVAVDVSTSHANQTAAPLDTSTTGATTNASDLIVAGLTTHSGVALTWSGFSTGYTNESGPSSSGATNNPWTQPSFKFVSATGSQTFSASPSNINGGAGVIVAYKATSPVVSSGVVNMGNVDGGLTAIATSVISAGLVTAGNVDGGLTAIALSSVITGLIDLGGNGTGIHGIATAIKSSGIFRVGSNGGDVIDTTIRATSFLGNNDAGTSRENYEVGGSGGISHPISVGSFGGLSHPISLGSGGALYTTASVVFFAIVGNNDYGGLGAHTTLGGSGGLLVTGGEFIEGAVLLGNNDTGIPEFNGHIGLPSGHWQFYTILIWRAGLGGWQYTTVKRWKTGTWHQF